MLKDLPSHARPEEPMLWFNGLDGRSGDYLMPPVPPRQLADFALGARTDLARVRELQAWVARGEGKARRGLKEGLDPGKLDEAGWGVIFPRSAAFEPLKEALAPLLDLRRGPGGEREGNLFPGIVGGGGHRGGGGKNALPPP